MLALRTHERAENQRPFSRARVVRKRTSFVWQISRRVIKIHFGSEGSNLTMSSGDDIDAKSLSEIRTTNCVQSTICSNGSESPSAIMTGIAQAPTASMRAEDQRASPRVMRTKSALSNAFVRDCSSCLPWLSENADDALGFPLLCFCAVVNWELGFKLEFEGIFVETGRSS